jgi:hypothetical protein
MFLLLSLLSFLVSLTAGVDKKDYFQHKNGYGDFFPLEEMKRRLGPDSIITMKEFLEREAYPGHLGRTPPVKRKIFCILHA